MFMKFVRMCSTDLVLGDKFTNTAGSYLINYDPIIKKVSVQKNPATNNADVSKVKTYYKEAHNALKQNEDGLWVPEDVPEFSKVSKDGTIREWKQMALDFIKNIGMRYKSMKLTMSDSYMIFLNKEDWKKFKAKNYNQIFLKEIVRSNSSEAEIELSKKHYEITNGVKTYGPIFTSKPLNNVL